MKNMSLTVRVSIIVLCALVVSSAIVGVISYALNKNDAVSYNAEKAKSLANAISDHIDSGEFVKIMQSRQEDEYYQTFEKYLDKIFNDNDLLYLYVLDKDYDADVTYFAEGFPYGGRTDEVRLELGHTESAEFYDALMYDTISTGVATSTDIYKSGDFGYMVSGFSSILDENGNVVGVVGVDISLQNVVASANRFGLVLIGIVVVLSLIVGLIITKYLRTSVGKPIRELTAAAERISKGDTNIAVQTNRSDEIGALVESFNRMAESTNDQAKVLEALANGNLNLEIAPRGESDVMGHAIAKMIFNLNDMFLMINESTQHVSNGANQIANGAQILAQGATEQAVTIENLSAKMSDVSSQTRRNADMAEKAAQLADEINGNAEKGSGQMEDMLKAVKEINDASNSIKNVIKLIDDIAFQTNILALNAAVEASRAGQYGKGFAVVAEEVRNLAQKSANSAKDSGELIANSIKKADLGVKIANETYTSIQKISQGIHESSAIVNDIARSSERQDLAITEINEGIEQVASVVQQNAATAEQSAAASEKMNEQAKMLETLVSRFELKAPNAR